MAEICNPEDIEKREESSEFPSPVSEPQIAYVYDEEKLQAVQNEIGGVRQELGEVRAVVSGICGNGRQRPAGRRTDGIALV